MEANPSNFGETSEGLSDRNSSGEFVSSPFQVPLYEFIFKALLWGAVTILISREFGTNRFWIVPLSVLFFSIPISLGGFYGTTIRQIRRLNIFNTRGLFFRLASGRPLKVVFWISWALVTSFFMLIQFHTYDLIQWAIYFLVIPFFWIVYFVARRQVEKEFKPYLVVSFALTWARRLCPILMVILYVVCMLYFGDTPHYDSLQEAMDDRKSQVVDMTGSELVREASQYLAMYEGIKIYALAQLGTVNALWALVLLAIGNIVVFYNAGTILSCFLIPWVEYRRIFGPLSDEDTPKPITISRTAGISAATTFLTIFVFLYFFVYLEISLQQAPQLAETPRGKAEETLKRLDENVLRNFNERMKEAENEFQRRLALSLDTMDTLSDRAFNRLDAKVDDYLDWYYSLVGEYSRIGMLLVGELEEYMANKFEEIIGYDELSKDLETIESRALAERNAIIRDYQKTIQNIIDENQVNIYEFPQYKDRLDLTYRLIGSSVGTVVGASISVIVLNKLVAKGVFKLAAKALAKVLAGKAAAAAGGTAIGAAIGGFFGSIMPGPGTAVGAAIGGAIGGVVAGVSMDKMLLMLEESLSREDFKKEILSSLQEARAEYKINLRQIYYGGV